MSISSSCKKLKITDTVEKKKGNTDPSSSRHRGFVITLNNYSEEEYMNILELCHTDTSTKWIFGKEIGKKCGTPHLQGFIYFKNARSWNNMKKLLPDRCHIEGSKGNCEDNYIYCSKEGNFETNIEPKNKAIEISKFKKLVLKKYENVIWKKWQQDILDKCNEIPDDRTINWYYDHDGNIGKSFLAKYLLLRKNVTIVSGKNNDIKFGVKCFINEYEKICTDDEPIIIIIIDIPRSMNDFVSYSAIEEIKNGCFFSGKYESDSCIFPNPHVFCFSNNLPEVKKLSNDRWNIVNINEEL